MYDTGIASTIEDLTNTICNFAVQHAGFTFKGNWVDVVDSKLQVFCLEKNGVYTLFAGHAESNRLYMSICETYDPSIGVNNLPNRAPFWACTNLLYYPFVGYHLFTDGTRVSCVVEIETGCFANLGFGNVDLCGSLQGGEYVVGTFVHNLQGNFSGHPGYSLNHFGYYIKGSGDLSAIQNQKTTSHMRVVIDGVRHYSILGCNADSLSGNYYGFTMTSCDTMWYDYYTTGYHFILYSYNTATGRNPIYPINLMGARASDGLYSHLGHIPGVGTINLENLTNKQIVNSDWMVFPMSERHGPHNKYFNTANYGLAFKM